MQNIYKKVVELFIAKGSKAEDLLVCISPSLGPKAAEFIHFKKELTPFFYDFRVEGNCFDFWEASKEQLKQEGVLPGHIQVAEVCTHTNVKDYFSYRKEKVTGRLATVAALH